MLHDIGYTPSLATTGFHPLDGARYLRDRSAADERLVRLVANHSYALLEAEERGLHEELGAEFPILDHAELVDALVYCDMATTPDGTPTTVDARLAEILTRYDRDSIVGRFIRRADEDLRAAVHRVEARLILAERYGRARRSVDDHEDLGPVWSCDQGCDPRCRIQRRPAHNSSPAW